MLQQSQSKLSQKSHSQRNITAKEIKFDLSNKHFSNNNSNDGKCLIQSNEAAKSNIVNNRQYLKNNPIDQKIQKTTIKKLQFGNATTTTTIIKNLLLYLIEHNVKSKTTRQKTKNLKTLSLNR